MSDYLRSAHVSRLLRSQKLTALHEEELAAFHRVAEAYPWRAAGIDWTALAPSSARPLDVDIDWFRQIEAVVPFLVLIYSKDEAIGGPTTSILTHLDELVWCAPGRRLCVGATAVDGTLSPVGDAIFEYDGGDTLRFYCPALTEKRRN